MIEVTTKMINKINTYLQHTNLPAFKLTKEKAFAYEKDGSKIYLFQNPLVEGVLLCVIINKNDVCIEYYPSIKNHKYQKIVYNFHNGEIIDYKINQINLNGAENETKHSK